MSQHLKADADNINNIITGINPGATTANTIKRFRELRTLWQKIETDVKGQIEGRPPGSAPQAPANPEGDWWK
jgi:hypothetical protein